MGSKNPEQTAIRGVYVAMLTPRRRGETAVDLAAALELIDFYCAKGTQGITLLGSTGEFLHFGIEERIRLVSMAVKRSRVPVLANVSHSTFDGALRMAQAAEAAGAAGVLLMPPYFFRYSQENVREFYLRFADEIHAPTRIMLYNIPSFTNEISSETSVELLSTGRFAGIKDSSGQWEYFLALKKLRETRPFALMVGQDSIFCRARREGAAGIISGCAAAVPELFVALDRALSNGNDGAAELLEARLREFLAWLGHFPMPVGIREAGATRGLTVGGAAVPLGPAAAAKRDEFLTWFGDWLGAVLKECASAS